MSRASLGKIIILGIKWRKKTRFLTCGVKRVRLRPSTGLLLHLMTSKRFLLLALLPILLLHLALLPFLRRLLLPG